MRITKFNILTILLFFIININYSASQKPISIDSLKSKSSQEKISRLNSYSKQLKDSYPNLALLYANKALNIADSTELFFEQISTLTLLGTINYEISDYVEAQKIFQKVIKQTSEKINSKHYAYAQHYLGLIYTKYANYDKAIDDCKIALNIYNNKKDKIQEAEVLKDIGNIYFYWNKKKSALEFYNQAIEINKEVNNQTGIAACYNNIGRLYTEIQNYNLAIEYLNKSLIIKQKQNETFALATIYINIGNIYEQKEEYKIALDYYYKAHSIYEKSANKSGLASIYRYLANVNSKLGYNSKSIKYYRKSISDRKSVV